MKNIFLKSRLVVLANFLFLSVSAQDFEVDGIYYNVTSIEDLEVEVTSYGDNHYNDEYDEHKYSGDIVIPETVTYKNRKLSVTSIGGWAFYGCSGLTSVDIPDGVTEIGSHAFYGCSGLTSVDIPDGVTSIGWAAFESCSGLTSVDIPDGVTSIGSRAFYYCRGLTSVDIPDGVTSIGEYAFYYCSGLTPVDIPNSVTSIGEGAFSHCDTIEEFIFPAGIQDYPTELFGSYDEYVDNYFGTIVNKLHISDSPNALNLSYLYGEYPVYYFEPYYLNLNELYIGRNLITTGPYGSCLIFPRILEKVEIGGCLKSDIIFSFEAFDHEESINDIGPTNIKTIIYGDSIAVITDPVTTASEIYLRSTTPPETDEWENSNYLNSILYVPQGTLTVYQNADVWKNFWDIREWDSTTTDIKSPTIDNTDAADISIDGKQVTVTTNNPGTRVQVYNTGGVLVYDGKEGTVNIETPGLYIIKAGNHTKKLLVK